MTTTLPIPGGLANKEIVDQAFMVLGLSDSMFGRTEEEYATGMSLLRAMAGEWPFDQLGFDDTDARIGGESGIERKWLTVMAHSLAERIGETLGKSLKPRAVSTKARAFSALCASVGTITEAGHALGTAAGSGHRNPVRTTYFSASE